MIKLIVLGTAQDGGVPHLGCRQPHCERARLDPTKARWVACLGVIDTDAQRSFLIDATPDIRPQLDYFTAHRLAPARSDRNPMDGIILTHAHIGHYTGLMQFGKEVLATRELPTYASACMIAFLMQNGPWSQLVRDKHLSLRVLADDQPIQLTNQLTIKPFLVPHRNEWSDTMGLEISGPNKRAIYIPDIDRWSDWQRDVREVVAQCDLALLDGCFYSADELPGRDMSLVPHPLITETMELLAPTLTLPRLQKAQTGEGNVNPLPQRGRGQGGGVYFTHLNHTNPAIDPDSPQRRAIEARGFHVAEDKQEFEL